MDVTSECKVEGIDDSGLRNNRGVIIIEGSVNLIVAREGVGRSEFSTWKDSPDDVKVL